MAGNLVISTINSKDISSSLVATESQVIGVGQTWQDVTASRVDGTTYTNSTGKPIQVGVYGANAGSAGGFGLTLTIGTTLHTQIPAQTTGPGNMTAYVNAIVPNGATYSISLIGATLLKWNELR